MKKCAICGHMKLLKTDISLFGVPSAQKKLKDWNVAAGFLFNPKSYICMKHFESKYIQVHRNNDDQILSRTLTHDAVPTLNLGCASTNNDHIPIFPVKQYPPKRETHFIQMPQVKRILTHESLLTGNDHVPVLPLQSGFQSITESNLIEVLSVNRTHMSKTLLTGNDHIPVLPIQPDSRSIGESYAMEVLSINRTLVPKPMLTGNDNIPILPLQSCPQSINESCPIEILLGDSSQDPEPYTSLPRDSCSPSYAYLARNYADISKLLPFEWGIHQMENEFIISHITPHTPIIDKAIVIGKDESKIYLNNIYRSVDTTFITMEDVFDLIQKVGAIMLCKGSGIGNRISRRCNGENCRKKSIRCLECALLRRTLVKQKLSFTTHNEILAVKKRKILNRCSVLKRKVSDKMNKIMDLQEKMAKLVNTQEILSKLPENQKLVVKTCLETAGQRRTGKRYNKDWIYSCILIRIKSPKLYRHLRNRELLPLPAPSTISRYIEHIDSSYGFQTKLFQLLKEKCQFMSEYERHGTLMVDECKITASKHFDKNRLKVLGFVDLGDYTPLHQKDQLGDHALVLMFQSFAGKNMQAIGCFLSKGNVPGNILAKLILEAIVLCEAAGLFIDVVTSDGATWNRSMWKHLGAGNPRAPWCIHPCNDDRNLRMCSDFPHLLKCLRNRLVDKKEFHVPEGRVQLSHFKKLIEHDAQYEFKLAPKLTVKHIHPIDQEKMTTRYAFQLFSGTVADALTTSNIKNTPGFLDCEATIQFCRRINRLSDILNSNNAASALRPQSSDYYEIEDFLIYLDLWESCAEGAHFLSKSTADGLRATINTTLHLTKYCAEELNFKYLMTSRINQDPLEHFFGLLRDCGGSNNRAESVQVAQIFRLMSLYSLVKPPRGSNVTGGNMLQVLVNDKENILNYNSLDNVAVTKKEIDIQLDRILEEDIASGTQVTFSDNQEAFAYVCGFLARKYKSETCQDCKKTIVGNGVEAFNTFITLRSRGHLIFPSAELLTLLEEVESVIGKTLQKEVKQGTLIDILHQLEDRKIAHSIGCTEHKLNLTKKIIFSFLMLRMSFSCKKESRKRSLEKRKAEKYAKLAKLV